VLKLSIEKKYISLALLYLLYPLIVLIDFISRPLHQYVLYKLFRKFLINYKYNKELISCYKEKEIAIINELINNIKGKHDVYFITTNLNIINQFLEKRYNPKKIYSVDLDKITLKYLREFKNNAIKEIVEEDNNSVLIGIADSKYDMCFLLKCDKAYLLKQNKLMKIL